MSPENFPTFPTSPKEMEKANWYFSKDELAMGYSTEELKRDDVIRKTTCSFIQDAGLKLRLPQLTIATANLLFHRFSLTHKLSEIDPHVSKVEETPKKLRDVIEVSQELKNKNDPSRKLDPQEFNVVKEQILTHELEVLQTVAFDLSVEHPYKYVLSYTKGIQGECSIVLTLGNQQLAQVAWNFVNDSFRTSLCLQFPPRVIAAGAIYLASKALTYQIPEGKQPWWEILEVQLEDLEEISSQILELYPTPVIDKIRGNVHEEKKTPQEPKEHKKVNPEREVKSLEAEKSSRERESDVKRSKERTRDDREYSRQDQRDRNLYQPIRHSHRERGTPY